MCLRFHARQLFFQVATKSRRRQRLDIFSLSSSWYHSAADIANIYMYHKRLQLIVISVVYSCGPKSKPADKDDSKEGDDKDEEPKLEEAVWEAKLKFLQVTRASCVWKVPHLSFLCLAALGIAIGSKTRPCMHTTDTVLKVMSSNGSITACTLITV